jgi:hypothetical protein
VERGEKLLIAEDAEGFAESAEKSF